MDDVENKPAADSPERDAAIMERRDAGASWAEIAGEFGLTRQGARYCYQRARRVVRRAARREK